MNRTSVICVFALSASLCFGVVVSALAADTVVKPLPPQYMNPINPTVQLQENEWVKVVNSYFYESTPEEFFGKSSDDPIVTIVKKAARDEGRSENFRIIGVDIQFLKPCQA